MNIRLETLQLVTDQVKPIRLNRAQVHVLFTLHHEVQLLMPGGRRMPLPVQSHYLFYEQHKDFTMDISGSGQLMVLLIPIDELHKLVSKGAEDLNFEAAKSFDTGSFHKFEGNSSSISNCLDSILVEKNPLILEAKKFELMGSLFSATDVKTYKCPFLNQKENVQKVRDAKMLLIQDLQDAPTIKQLSRKVGLNEYNLKTGFKEIYGKPVYTFLKDFRINEAQKLLDNKQYQVNEVAEMIGYSNVSHFIEAFRKKFGLTPKQYSLNQN